MAKEPKHKRLYKNSPKLERDEGGAMAVSKKQADTDEAQAGTEGEDGKADGMPMEARHAHERRDMHNRHETQHSVHDHIGGPKKELHDRHEKEMKDMHTRHEKEDVKQYDNPAGDSNEKPNAGKKEIAEVGQSKENTE